MTPWNTVRNILCMNIGVLCSMIKDYTAGLFFATGGTGANTEYDFQPVGASAPTSIQIIPNSGAAPIAVDLCPVIAACTASMDVDRVESDGNGQLTITATDQSGTVTTESISLTPHPNQVGAFNLTFAGQTAVICPCPAPPVNFTPAVTGAPTDAEALAAAAGSPANTIIWTGGTSANPNFAWIVQSDGSVINVESPISVLTPNTFNATQADVANGGYYVYSSTAGNVNVPIPYVARVGTIAAGLAATSDGQTFIVDNGTGNCERTYINENGTAHPQARESRLRGFQGAAGGVLTGDFHAGGGAAELQPLLTGVVGQDIFWGDISAQPAVGTTDPNLAGSVSYTNTSCYPVSAWGHISPGSLLITANPGLRLDVIWQYGFQTNAGAINWNTPANEIFASWYDNSADPGPASRLTFNGGLGRVRLNNLAPGDTVNVYMRLRIARLDDVSDIVNMQWEGPHLVMPILEYLPA